MAARRWWEVASVVALLVAATAGCTVEEAYSGSPDGPKVGVLGDSITHQSAAEIHAALDPDHQVRIIAATGATFTDGKPHAEVLAATEPAAVVVDLGTNDVWKGLALEDIEAEMDAVASSLDGTCLVLTTLNEHTVNAVAGDGSLYDNDRAMAVNDLLRARADVVADWNAAVNTDPARYLDAGTIHPTPDGRALLAQLFQDAVASC